MSTNEIVCGLKSASGVIIRGITRHAEERIFTRGLLIDELVDLIINARIIYPDRNPSRICQQDGNWKLVIERETGYIVTVIKLGSKG